MEKAIMAPSEKPELPERMATVEAGVVELVGCQQAMTGYTCKYAMKANKSDTAYIVSPTVGTITDGVAGVSNAKLNATILPSVTKTIAAGTYWEEFELSVGADAYLVVRSFQRQHVVDTDIVKPAT